jgi:hypothetical protein
MDLPGEQGRCGGPGEILDHVNRRNRTSSIAFSDEAAQVHKAQHRESQSDELYLPYVKIDAPGRHRHGAIDAPSRVLRIALPRKVVRLFLPRNIICFHLPRKIVCLCLPRKIVRLSLPKEPPVYPRRNMVCTSGPWWKCSSR